MEGVHHMWKCEGVQVVTARGAIWERVKGRLREKKQEGIRRVVELWETQLRAKAEGYTGIIEEITDEEQRAMECQSRVGWDQVYVRRVVKEWENIWRRNECGRTRGLCMARLGWELGQGCWRIRNDMMHGSIEGEEKIRWKRVWEEVRRMKEEVQGGWEVREEEGWMFAEDDKEKMRRSDEYLEKMCVSMELCLKKKENED